MVTSSWPDWRLAAGGWRLAAATGGCDWPGPTLVRLPLLPLLASSLHKPLVVSMV